MGPYSIRVMLRNDEGKVAMIFSKSVGEGGANMPELKAIPEAVRTIDYATGSLGKNLPLMVIESNLKMAVGWVKSLQPKSWKHNNTLNEI